MRIDMIRTMPIYPMHNPPSHQDTCHAPKKDNVRADFEKMLQDEMKKKNK